MLYTIHINQVKAAEWQINSNQAFVFAVIHQLPTWADSVNLDGKQWYHLSKTKLCEEIPLVTDKPDTAWRHMKSLADKGIIELTSLGKRTLVRITEKGLEWNRTDLPIDGNKSEPRKNIRAVEENPSSGNISEERKNIQVTEKNPPDLGKISELTSEIFPTDNYTSNTNNQDQPKDFCATDSDEPEARHSKSTPDPLSAETTPCSPPTKTAECYTSASGHNLTGENLANFEEFWEIFNYKKDKARAADAWLKISWTKKTEHKAAELNREKLVMILAGAAIERAQREYKVQAGQTPCYAEKWLSARRWEDEDPDMVAQRLALREEINVVPHNTPKQARERVREVLRDVMATDW